jgi:membrane protease YdiL (CAAX protease family)
MSTPPEPQRPVPPAAPGGPPFPGLLGALWLVLASIILESLAWPLLAGLGGLGNDESAALARLMAHAALFSGLVAFTGLSYRALFHAGRASPGAVLGLTLLPVLALVPGLVVMETTLLGWIEALVPLSAWEQQAFEAMSADTPGSILMTCLLAPVLEEMLFRGVILRAFLQRYPRGVAIVHSAAIFGLAHMNLYQFIGGLTMGLIAGWLYERTRSLWPCITLHAAYNSSLTWLSLRAPAGAEAAAGPGSAGLALAAALLAALWLKRCLQPAAR